MCPYLALPFYIEELSMTTDTKIVLSTSSSISTVARLAIAGIWLACIAVSVFIVLVFFVWADPVDSVTTELSSDNALVLWIVIILMIAAPLVAASSATKKITDKCF
jgi:hypothetical protein